MFQYAKPSFKGILIPGFSQSSYPNKAKFIFLLFGIRSVRIYNQVSQNIELGQSEYGMDGMVIDPIWSQAHGVTTTSLIYISYTAGKKEMITFSIIIVVTIIIITPA